MSKRVKERWDSFSLMVRLLIVVAVVAAVVSGPIMALADTVEAPTASNWKPAKDSTTNVSNPEVSLYVTDTVDDLNSNSLVAKINGQQVQATLQYKGHWEYDSCGGNWWVVDSRKEGTISFKTAGLPDGQNTVEIIIADIAGNIMTESWSFTVAEAPKIKNISPPNGSEHVTVNKVSAVISDNSSVNWDSVKFIVAGTRVSPTSFDQTTNTVTYEYGFPIGDNTVSLEANDEAGTATSTQWSFSVGGSPTPSNWVPAKDITIDISNPAISLYLTDAKNSLNASSVTAKIDGTSVQANFQYKGHYDSCTGDYYVESYKEGTVSFNTTGLKDGLHEVEIHIADVIGNVLVEKWQFIVAEAPKISTVSPTDKSESTGASKISAVINDNSSVDWNSVRFTINGSTVTPSLVESVNTAVYYYDFSTGNHTIKVEAKDPAGTLSSKTWSFIVDTEAPKISYLDSFSDNMTITDGKLNINIGLKDLVDLKDNASLSLDGNPLNANFRYKGYWDSCSDIYYVETLKEAIIEYEGIVANGDHILTLYTEDKLGNKETYNWSFKVVTKPVISNQAPIQILNDLTPSISANVKLINGTIDSEDIMLKLNGTVVNHDYDPSVGKVTYTPTNNLANETYYTVNLTVLDNTNLTSNSTWKFNLNTYPDMPDSNISNCTMCHTLKSSTYLNGDFEKVHAYKLSFGGDHSRNDCANCHNYISQGDGCAQCHGDVDFDYAPHGSTPAIKYSATSYDRMFPIRIKTNREMWDCVICHQPGAGTRNSYNILLNNHDVPELHKTSTEGYDDCSKCHSKSLTREHTRDGRTDQAGNKITCQTCHENTSLQPIIGENKTDCASCHTNVDHNELHTYNNFDSSCMTSGCHSNVLSTEHDTRGLSCEGCHDSATNSSYTADFKQGIYNAITWNQLSCSECHSGPIKHGVTLAKEIPEGLKYTSSTGNLEWMNPKSISFWQGESWVPTDMYDGLYTVSKRDGSLSGVDVFNFYETKMVELGWTKSAGPSTGSDKFELIYIKGKAKAIVRFYEGHHYDSSSLNKGYRIEILYKYLY